MLKARVIPILTFNGFALVKTKCFDNPRMVGNPVQAARVYNSRGVDELIFLDICASDEERSPDLDMIRGVIKECLMPIGIGGGIATLDHINDLLRVGADKVVIKTKALNEPEFIEEAAKVFGSQCITVAVDAVRENDDYIIYNKCNKSITLRDFVKQCEDLGAGEFIVNSVDNDGSMSGFDLELIRTVQNLSMLPLVACGGGGEPAHYAELFRETNVEAVGSASIFHFTQYTPNDIKKELERINIPVRLL